MEAQKHIKTPRGFPSLSDCKFGNTGEICASKDVVESMRRLVDKLSKENKDADGTESDKSVVYKAKELLNCDTESCVVASKEFADIVGQSQVSKIKSEIFKPSGPWKKNDWLSNINIDQVLDQWANIYTGYHHIPFKMNDTLRNVKFDDIDKNGMHCFSVAVNTDNSSGPGVHWFCVYGDFADKKKRKLEYFNSSGAKPSREVHEWLHKTKHETEKNLGDDTEIVMVHKNDLQKGMSECGLFVLFYIYSRLNEVPHSYFFKSESADDKTMFEFRKHVFRTHK